MVCFAPQRYTTVLAPVAQLDRVPGYERGGRTFESCQARHIKEKAPSSEGAFSFMGCPPRVNVAKRRFATFDKLRRIGAVWTPAAPKARGRPEGQNSPKAVLINRASQLGPQSCQSTRSPIVPGNSVPNRARQLCPQSCQATLPPIVPGNSVSNRARQLDPHLARQFRAPHNRVRAVSTLSNHPLTTINTLRDSS